MKYISTRGSGERLSASEAILQGIAKDGGLFVPEEFPQLDKSLSELAALDYQTLAYDILKLFLTDYTENELKTIIANAYNSSTFDAPTIAPLVKKGNSYFLELFHGRTLAFKDVALSILPYLVKTAAQKTGADKEIVVLTATSGDTGKAALEGFKDVPGTKIIVFYPENGVSAMQKAQMTTQDGGNVQVIGIRGNFDDAQTAVKKAFTDDRLNEKLSEHGYMFSSANSINIGRLLPQIVYYFHAYFQMVRAKEIAFGDGVSFVVPTGNFGNILAGYYAKKLGLPVSKFVCASNENKILFDFFHTNEYNTNRAFVQTTSPSMDILISSNLERLLFDAVKNPETVKQLMDDLRSGGKYRLDAAFPDFAAEFANEDEVKDAIREVYNTANYVIDTHTAIAYCAAQKYETTDQKIILSTASPYKFPRAVWDAITGDRRMEGATLNDFAFAEKLASLAGEKVPEKISELKNKASRFQEVIEKNEVEDAVVKFLKI